jgi:hypothetical protein
VTVKETDCEIIQTEIGHLVARRRQTFSKTRPFLSGNRPATLDVHPQYLYIYKTLRYVPHGPAVSGLQERNRTY